MRYLTNSTILVLLASTNLTKQTTLTNENDKTTNQNNTFGLFNDTTLKEDEDLNFQQTQIDEAAIRGLDVMRELHSIKEPLLYKMGFYLDPSEPSGRLATFKEPSIKATLQAKYGYATIQAALHLAQKSSLGRQNQEFAEEVFSDILSEQCPLKETPRCTLASEKYRTSDGTCNNLKEPWLGSALSPLFRFLPPAYEDGIQSERKSIFGTDLPSARRISVTIHHEKNIDMPSISLMFMQWGQLLDHDLISTASSRAFNSSIPRCCLPRGIGFLPFEFLHPECMPISVPKSDHFFNQFNIQCMEFVRSAPATRIDCKLGWREQINQATSYLDASMIYGNDVQRSEALRTFKSGQLMFGMKRRNDLCKLGIISTHCFSGGDSRFSEQPALTALHMIWVQFHNQIAKGLQRINTHWSDEKLYQESRRIVGALIQHITYREFLPVVLGPEVTELFELKLLRKGYYENYDADVNPSTSNAFSTAAFRFGHSLVQSSFIRTSVDHRILSNNVSIHQESENFENVLTPGSLDRLVLGLINQASQMRDEFISEELTNHLFQNPGGFFGIDLAAVNVQRGRDHGIPPYTSWRVPCGLAPIEKWSDLLKVMRKESVLKFRDLYRNVDDIDLYSGGLAEHPVRGGLVGPVFACIIAQQFMNYRKGDRFWYENGEFKSSFNLEQLGEIRKVSLAEIICRTLVEVETVQNFVFLLADEENNPRKRCEEIVFESFNLKYWKDELPFEDSSNAIDFQNGRKLDLSRHIGDYIMETFEDYYDDSYEYEEHVGRPKKKKKHSTSKRPLLRKPTTFNSTTVLIKEEIFPITTQVPQILEKPTFDLIHKKVIPLNVVEKNEDVFVLHDLAKLNSPSEEKSNYQVNININYVLGNNVDKTTKRPTNFKRPYFDNSKPLISVNTLQKPYEQTTLKPTKYPIYLLDTKTTTKPDYVTGYQIKKTTTKKYQDIPIFMASNSYTTKKTYVQNTDYDLIYEDVTTKRPFRPNFQQFPTNKPGFSIHRPDSNLYETINTRPIYVKDPIDDVYMTILHRPANYVQNKDETIHIDDKLDFKSELLPHRLKVKNTNMVKIYSVKSPGLERSSDGREGEGEEFLLPELDGIKIVQMDVLPSETKFSTYEPNESKDETPIPNLKFSNLEFTKELPKQMSHKGRN